MSKRFVFTMGAGLVGAMCGALFWAGCGGSATNNPPADAGMDTSKSPQDSGNPQDSGAMDAPVDMGTAMDAPADVMHQVLDSGPLICGTQQCGAGTECCATYVPPPVPDAGADAGDAGDAGPTGVGTVDFQCLATCPDGGAPIQCDSPQQCGADAGGSICCGTIQTMAGSGAGGCAFGTVTSSCTTSCTSSITLSCGAPETVQFCAQVADCTDRTTRPAARSAMADRPRRSV